MKVSPWSIWLVLLGISLLSGCDVAYPTLERGDPAVSHGKVGNAFDLIGAHSQIPCYSCHLSGTFDPRFDPMDANDCVACHQSDYDGKHADSGYPTTCSACHTPTDWSDGTFNHTTISGGFDLLGTHSSKACTVCHDATTFAPLFDPADANDCAACHQTDYNGEHAGSGYPTSCLDCHTPTAWSDGTFNHTAISGGFELLGTHTSKPCTVCHDAATFEPRFNPVDASDCVACHQSDYDRQHTGSGYPTNCLDCHTPTAWSNGTLNHTTVSGGFELLGTHAEKACTVCHDATTFEPLFNPADASDCVACHQPDYDGHHAGSGYPTTCSACHTPTVWSDGSLDHTTVSGGFELLGTHASKACTVCHDATTFEPLFDPVDASDCVACHQPDYDGHHSGSGYPTTCSACHTPTVWSDGSLDHTTVSGGFELLGTHTSKACTVCHDATTFEPLFDPVDASDCVACHQSDYDGQHTGSGYPTNCTACHTPTAWSGAFETSCLTCHDGSPPPGTTFPAPNWSGFDKATFVGTAHDTPQGGTDSCRGCHEQHGASQHAFLLATYVMSDGNQWTQGDGDYQLCWNCHDEDYVMNQVNAFEDLHDKHVNGEDTPCAMCHDPHAPHDAGESLINFDFAVQNGYDIEYIDGRDASTSFWRAATDGFCYITCHNKRHDPQDYVRQ